MKGFSLEGFTQSKIDILHFVLHSLRFFKQFVIDSNKIDNVSSLQLLMLPSDLKILKAVIKQISV